MPQFLLILNVILPIFYGLAMLLYGFHFHTKEAKYGTKASILLTFSVFLHICYACVRGIYLKQFPITNSFDSLSIVALHVAAIYLVTERSIKERTTGIFFVSLVFICSLIGTIGYRESKLPDAVTSHPLHSIHTIFILLGISAILVSALYGLMYWMLAKEIKRRHFGAIYDRLPPLEILNEMREYSTVCGIFFLGMGIFLGHFWAGQIFGNFFISDPKVILTDIGWFLYSLLWLWGWKKNWPRLFVNQLAFWSCIAFFFSVIIVNLLADTFHRFS